MMPRYEISLSKIYRFPDELKTIEYKQSILVIAPHFANWIVLKSKAQYEVFCFLRENHSIQDALYSKRFTQEDINYVVTQIEARKLCDKTIHRASQNERSMHLYLTNQCNLFCPHCYMFSGQANDSELTTGEIMELITAFRKIARGSIITLSGGEPSYRTDFDLIVISAARMGFEVKILTNGTLMTPERVSVLADYVYSVQISIDGFSEATNSLVRGTGSFDKALSAVELFLSHNIDTSIAITPPYSILKNHIDDYIQFAKELSNKYKDKPFRVKFAEEILNGRCVETSRDFNNEYFGLMRELQRRLYGPEFDVMSFVDMLYNNSVLDNCMFGNISVASNGDVFYCARIGDLLPMANVRESSFEEIFEKALKAEQATYISNLRPCNECELRFICGGGCRIEEFPTLVRRTSFDNVDYLSIPPRSCDQQIKNNFYDLMVRSNEYFYTSLI